MRVWGITDGSAGMQSQVIGVGHALGGEFTLKTVRRRAPFVWLPAHWLYRHALTQTEAGSDALAPPWPDIVISSGRRSAAFALAIKRASGGKTRIVHLTDPRIPARYFDLVAPMEHDGLEGPNVLPTRFALHKLTHGQLAEAKVKWEPVFSHLPRPWLGVLIGGGTNRYRFGAPEAASLAQTLAAFARENKASLLVTPSRRTGEENTAIIRDALQAQAGDSLWFYGGAGENPYLGILACADALIVTDDSVNMMSEAAYTQKPLYVLNLPGHAHTKPARFAQRLMQAGVARPPEGTLATWRYEAPDERARVAEAIRALCA